MITEADKIDIISQEPSGAYTLIITDHLDWSDSHSHQLILQTKINTYLAYLGSGQLVSQMPDAAGKAVNIRVVAMSDPDEPGLQFYARMGDALAQRGIGFERRKLEIAAG